jgi:hypothetical protein
MYGPAMRRKPERFVGSAASQQCIRPLIGLLSVPAPHSASSPLEPEEEEVGWWVEVQPGNYMAFSEP